MNADLEKAWRNGLAPFHGLTLYVEEPVAFLAMQRASRIVCNHLKSHFNDEAFFAIKDWHEHDGVVFDEEPFDLSTVEKALPSPELLGALDSGDHQVRRGIFPVSKDTPQNNRHEFPGRLGLIV